MLQSLHRGIVGETLIFMSDKALFHLSGSENAHNTHHWGAKNTINEVQLHDQKASVWCAVSAQRIIGYIFFLWNSELQMLCKQYFGTILPNAH